MKISWGWVAVPPEHHQHPRSELATRLCPTADTEHSLGLNSIAPASLLFKIDFFSKSQRKPMNQPAHDRRTRNKIKKHFYGTFFLELAAKPQQVTDAQQRKGFPLNFAPPVGSVDHVKKPCEGLLLRRRAGGNRGALVRANLSFFHIPPFLCCSLWTSWSPPPAARCAPAAGLFATCLNCQVMWESISINGRDYLIGLRI